jgi:hypothetical protein
MRTVMPALSVNLLEQCLIGQAPFSGQLREGQPQRIFQAQAYLAPVHFGGALEGSAYTCHVNAVAWDHEIT